MRCSHCGLPSEASLATGGLREPLCSRCVEIRTGVTGLTGLANALVGDRKPTEVCPHCGTTADEARRTALAGCPLCYTALKEVWTDLGAVAGRYAEGRDNGC